MKNLYNHTDQIIEFQNNQSLKIDTHDYNGKLKEYRKNLFVQDSNNFNYNLFDANLYTKKSYYNNKNFIYVPKNNTTSLKPNDDECGLYFNSGDYIYWNQQFPIKTSYLPLYLNIKFKAYDYSSGLCVFIRELPTYTNSMTNTYYGLQFDQYGYITIYGMKINNIPYFDNKFHQLLLTIYNDHTITYDIQNNNTSTISYSASDKFRTENDYFYNFRYFIIGCSEVSNRNWKWFNGIIRKVGLSTMDPYASA